MSYKIEPLKQGISLFILSCLISCGAENNSMKYPITHKVDVKETIHGEVIEDPYRWLEDDRSEETSAWVKAENKVTFDYLAQIPYREQLKSRLAELWNYEKVPILSSKCG